MATDPVVTRWTRMVGKTSRMYVRCGTGWVGVMRVGLHVAGVGACHRVKAEGVGMAVVDGTVGGTSWVVVEPQPMRGVVVVPPTVTVGTVVVVVKVVWRHMVMWLHR